MISILTLTYKRHKILEEAIYSFLLQNRNDCEMIIINDAKEVTYNIEYPNVKIYNVENRFSSISKKLEWGFKQAKYEYVYRLDDDDLLAKNAIDTVCQNIDGEHEIFRSSYHYLFVNNNYSSTSSNINNGNIYTKKYISRITFGNSSFGEDCDITFGHYAKIKEFKEPTMIYRWGMNTYHVSGAGNIPENEMRKIIENIAEKESGSIELKPNFMEDYYAKIHR